MRLVVRTFIFCGAVLVGCAPPCASVGLCDLPRATDIFFYATGRPIQPLGGPCGSEWCDGRVGRAGRAGSCVNAHTKASWAAFAPRSIAARLMWRTRIRWAWLTSSAHGSPTT